MTGQVPPASKVPSSVAGKRWPKEIVTAIRQHPDDVAKVARIAPDRVRAFLDGRLLLTSAEVLQLRGAGIRTAPGTGDGSPTAQAYSPKPKRCVCGEPGYRHLRKCRSCLLASGWRLCESCSRPMEPDYRRRRCIDCRPAPAKAKALAKAKREAKTTGVKQGKSVRTVSGGLPTLGRRR